MNEVFESIKNQVVYKSIKRLIEKVLERDGQAVKHIIERLAVEYEKKYPNRATKLRSLIKEFPSPLEQEQEDEGMEICSLCNDPVLRARITSQNKGPYPYLSQEEMEEREKDLERKFDEILHIPFGESSIISSSDEVIFLLKGSPSQQVEVTVKDYRLTFLSKQIYIQYQVGKNWKIEIEGYHYRIDKHTFTHLGRI